MWSCREKLQPVFTCGDTSAEWPFCNCAFWWSLTFQVLYSIINVVFFLHVMLGIARHWLSCTSEACTFLFSGISLTSSIICDKNGSIFLAVIIVKIVGCKLHDFPFLTVTISSSKPLYVPLLLYKKLWKNWNLFQRRWEKSLWFAGELEYAH